MGKLSAARETALKALYETEKNGAYLNIALREILKGDLSARDKALATEIALGVQKNKLYIDNIIKHLSNVKMKKLSLWILNILRIGVYSIKFLDRVPVSATVNECVSLARRYGHSASAGYVNAILRKSSVSGDFLPEEKAARICVKYSFPMWLTKLWQEYGEGFFASMNETPPVFVRMNTLKTQVLGENFEKSSKAKFAYIYTGKGSVENTKEYKNGFITVQDAASQMSVELMNPEENSLVLDLCAAPGGKTTYIAQLMKNTGKLISCDIYPHKLELIKSNLRRMGIKNTEVMLNDASVFNADFENKFDRVLADVPCSGLGIIRRKPDIKWTKTYDDILSLLPLQEKILDNAAKYVKPGGILLFSTCTINEKENSGNEESFLKRNPSFLSIKKGKQLLPNKDGTDGFFMAAFQKKR